VLVVHLDNVAPPSDMSQNNSPQTSNPAADGPGKLAMPDLPDEFSPRHIARRLAEFVVFGAIVVLAISALPGLSTLRHRFADADLVLVALVGVCKLASCLSNILAFRDVFCPRLGWGFSYRLGMAEQATNVLVPTGGAGGLALGAWALRRGGMSPEHITRRSVAFFVITSAPNFLCAVIIGPLLAVRLLHGHAPLVPTLVLTGLAIGTIAFAAVLPHALERIRPSDAGGRARRTIRSGLTSLAAGIRDSGALLYPRSRDALPRPARIRVTAGAIGYLGFDICAFAVAFAAFGGTPPLGALVFGYVIGQLGGLIPLPGGIGGTDGGLIGAMVLYGASLSQATAAVVVYRTFQLGVPAILGTIAFVQLRHTIGRSDKPTEMCSPLADPINRAEREGASAG
jgi:uncharacterized membrane protein YbhN (UPF0104 family)